MIKYKGKCYIVPKDSSKSQIQAACDNVPNACILDYDDLQGYISRISDLNKTELESSQKDLDKLNKIIDKNLDTIELIRAFKVIKQQLFDNK